MRKLIVVTGNHDGILGVYTNKKLAYERAVEYVEGAYDTKLNMTYAQFCKNMKEAWSTVEVGDGYATARCQGFIANR